MKTLNKKCSNCKYCHYSDYYYQNYCDAFGYDEPPNEYMRTDEVDGCCCSAKILKKKAEENISELIEIYSNDAGQNELLELLTK